MTKFKWALILVNLVAVLAFFNVSIQRKEAILADGKLLLLKLAPVDPRSLMQGDYMTLQYELTQDINVERIPKRGYFVVNLQADGVAGKVRLQTEARPLKNNEFLIKYTLGSNNMNLGAESYFFEEGQSEKFAVAKYGGIKIDNNGNSVLVGLYDEELKKID
jgi:uncharacterized membrane-anchored protein